MAPAITLAQLRELEPCSNRLAAMEAALPKRRGVTAAEAYQAGASLNDLVWVASEVARNDKDVARRLRMWIADVAAHVMHLYEQKSPSDQRPRNAIIAARAFAAGEIDAATRDAARDAARAAAWAATWAARDAARDAARAATWAARDAARAAVWAAKAARGAARDAAWADEEQWHLERLLAWFSDDEPEPWPLPEVQSVETT